VLKRARGRSAIDGTPSDQQPEHDAHQPGAIPLIPEGEHEQQRGNADRIHARQCTRAITGQALGE
jgi:hypothetical protein